MKFPQSTRLRRSISNPNENRSRHRYCVTIQSLQAWVFHILPDGESGAVWVAQRVPDSHVSPIANHFVIRDVHCDDVHNFLCGKSIFETAKKRGLWNPSRDGEHKTTDGKTTANILDFERVYAPDARMYLSHGSVAIPYYVTQRIWRVYDTLCRDPQVHQLPLTDDTRDYPFSMQVVRGVRREDVQRLHGDRYEGSKYDQREGMMAGAFGNPNRLEGGTGVYVLKTQVITR